MSHFPCADHTALPGGCPRRRRVTLLASCALAVGALGLSPVPALAGCNSGNVNASDLLFSGNCQGYGTGTNATAVGLAAYATGHSSAAFGATAFAKGAGATALGYGAGTDAAIAGATSVGAFAGYNGQGAYSTAVGGAGSSGVGALAQGAYSIAIGGGDGAVFQPTVGPAINLNGAKATGYISTGVGAAVQATGGGSSAFGLGSKATADNSSAYGEFSTASGEGSIAVGLYSVASAADTIAIGTEAVASKTGAVAIGNGSIAKQANTVSVGRPKHERRIVNVAPAVAATDAVNLAQVQSLIAAAATPAGQRASAPADGTPSMRLERQYPGPVPNTVIQRWRDPASGVICYFYLPVGALESAPSDSVPVPSLASLGSISCVPSNELVEARAVSPAESAAQ